MRVSNRASRLWKREACSVALLLILFFCLCWLRQLDSKFGLGDILVYTALRNIELVSNQMSENAANLILALVEAAFGGVLGYAAARSSRLLEMGQLGLAFLLIVIVGVFQAFFFCRVVLG